jgi:hypothetical protein
VHLVGFTIEIGNYCIFLNLIWKVYHYFETSILVHKANTQTAERVKFVSCRLSHIQEISGSY